LVGRAKPDLTTLEGGELRDRARRFDAALERVESLSKACQVVVRAAQALGKLSELVGLFRPFDTVSELADPPLQPKPFALEPESFRIAVGQRMLHFGEDRDRGVGAVLLEEQPDAIDERGKVAAAHRHV
jgi:hypothetical protein